MAPNQRGTVARLGFLCVLGGTLSSFMIAAIAGLLY
jgi:nucleoside permease NupC